MPLKTNQRGATFYETIEFVIENCCNCGVPFAITRQTYTQRRQDKELFYCPNGHPQAYTRSTEQKLREELAQTTAKLDQAQTEARQQREARERAEKETAKARKQTTRLKTRASGGACPCCNRYFPDLHAHMSTKHWTEQQESGVSPAVPRAKA